MGFGINWCIKPKLPIRETLMNCVQLPGFFFLIHKKKYYIVWVYESKKIKPRIECVTSILDENIYQSWKLTRDCFSQTRIKWSVLNFQAKLEKSDSQKEIKFAVDVQAGLRWKVAHSSGANIIAGGSAAALVL